MEKINNRKEESVSSSSPSDENMPPVRRRTYSESLRLHSLAAEALVAMPMRAPELSKTAAKGIHDPSTQSPDTGQRIIEIADTTNPKASSGELAAAIGDPGALLNLGLQSSKDSRDVLVEGPSKAGISMSSFGCHRATARAFWPKHFRRGHSEGVAGQCPKPTWRWSFWGCLLCWRHFHYRQSGGIYCWERKALPLSTVPIQQRKQRLHKAAPTCS